MMNQKVVMLSKCDNTFCDFAEAILLSYFAKAEVVSIRGCTGDTINIEELIRCKPDYLISFVSPWIVPKELINSVEIAAINFHPGSPDYPGTGCYNFALYEKAARYGITCHHMKAKVDTGDIIKVRYFDIAPNESVESLKLKSMNHMLLCFSEVIEDIYHNRGLPVSGEKWKREPFTRKQLNELCRIEPTTDTKEEINLRIRSTYYPGAGGAYIEIDGNTFNLVADDRKPIV